MIAHDECFHLGHIIKTWGYEGQLLFYLDTDSPQRYKKLESVFIEINKELIPFFIKNISFQSTKKIIVTLEDVNSFDKAQKLVNCQLFLPLDMLPPLRGKKFYFHEVIGFSVYDKKHGEIGKITEILENAAYPIFSISSQNTEILIPATDSIINKIDRKNKSIYITAPEGLIDIYINPDDNNDERDDD